MSGPNPLDYGWWLASRSAGIVALVAVSISVLIGLMMANGLPRRPGVKRRLLAVHESTALAGLVAISVHGLTLLGDSYLRATIANLLVPFTLGYRPLFTGLGVIAGWGAALLGLSFYVRRRIGTKLWRKLHRLTVAVWALGVIHTLGAGTDAGQVWLQAIVAVTGIPIAFLFLMRMLPGERRPAPLPATAPARGAARSAARRTSAERTGGRRPAEVAR